VNKQKEQAGHEQARTIEDHDHGGGRYRRYRRHRCLYANRRDYQSFAVIQGGAEIRIRPQQGRKVFTLQTLPACDEPFDDPVGNAAGFSLNLKSSTPTAQAV